MEVVDAIQHALDKLDPMTALLICLGVIVVTMLASFEIGDAAAAADDHWTNYDPQSWDRW